MATEPRVALVTGCSAGGMGFYFCRHLRGQGYRVFATARRASSMQELSADGCDLLELDVTDQDSLSSAVEKVSAATGGKLHLLVNNAGRGLVSPILTASLTDIRALYETNVFGLVACTQAFAPLLIRTTAAASAGDGENGFRPKVVNVGSVAGIHAAPWSGLYSSTKGAVHRLSDALRLELKGFGVDVLVIAPGVIKTGFGDNAASYLEGVKDNNKALEEEFYPNLAELLESRRKALYEGPRSDANTWAKEQVAIMTRQRAPAYWISGARSWIANVLQPYFPTWLVDRIIGGASGCGLVRYQPKRA